MEVTRERKQLAYYHFQMTKVAQESSQMTADLKENVECFMKMDPDNFEYQVFYAEVKYLLGEIEESKNHLRQIFKHNFGNKSSIQTYADCLLHQAQYQNGIKGFQRMLSKEQQAYSSYSILVVLIWFYRNSGKLSLFKEKFDSFKKQILNPLDPTIAFCEGLINYFIRNYNKAIEYLMIAKQDKDYSN